MSKLTELETDIRKGRRFRHNSWPEDVYLSREDPMRNIPAESLFSDGWEVEPEAKMITRAQLEKAYRTVHNPMDCTHIEYFQQMCNLLGLY